MASIQSVSLKITVSSGKVTPVVTYKLNFSQGDLNLLKQFPNLYSVRCELWGADSGLNGGDDKLFIYPITRSYPDGTITAQETGTFQATLNKGAELDEDWESQDEVYAKVILSNNFAGTKSSKNSSQVTGSF
ncbi:MAG: hypothetical protein RI907_1908 [Pseudomonadota bacterium]|jgi:hypothetical protein